MKLAKDCCVHPREMWTTLCRWFNGSVWMRRYRCTVCVREWEAYEDAGGEDV